MGIEDLHALTPIPALDPMSLGVPAAPQAPAPVPQVGQPIQQQKSQKLLSLAALAAMIAGGRATNGLGAGVLQGQQRMEDERQQREQQTIRQAELEQIQYQRQQQAYQQTLQQRQQTLMGAVKDIRTQVSAVKDKATYDQQVEGFANLLRSSGYRVDANWLRQAAPFVAPNAQDRASKALDDVLKNPMTVEAMKADPQRVMASKVMFDGNGDGVPEAYGFQELAAMAGRPMVADDQGQPLVPTKEEGKIGTPFQSVLGADLEQFRAENRREPNPKEKQAIVQAAILKTKEKPETGVSAVTNEIGELRRDLLAQQVEAARQKNAPQTDASAAYGAERTQRIVSDVDALLPKVSKWTVGPGALLSSAPGTDAANFAAELDTLKGNIAFNELTEMRAASKTGGALGAISNTELGLLSSALGALSTKQSPASFKKQLLKIKASLQRWEAAKAQQVPAPVTPMSSHGGKTYGKYTFTVEQP